MVLDVSSQCRSSRTTTRGPSVSSMRWTYAAATSVRIVAVSTGSSGTLTASASQPENAASRATAAIAPPYRRSAASSVPGVNSSLRA